MSAGGVRIVAADTPAALDEARTLFREYVGFLGEDFYDPEGDFERELAALPDGYLVILLAEVDGATAGTVALRRLDDDVCELKRLYCRPAFRGRGLGRALAERLFAEARALGFARVRLDTLDRLPDAVGLYQALGFRPIAPYNDNRMDGIMHLEAKL